ncbi:MAG: hypothetical protein EON54_25425, partial [Alcaligenaceae bacterium]
AYLYHLLRLKRLRQHARLNFSGSSGHQRVDQDFFSRMEIPVPPMKVQQAISAKADSIKAEARRLFARASRELDEAKAEIEALILGDHE